uniref:Uncharacterized protein n=1 Tax=Vitiosangium cumulatum TaxID=1867796 RepID=A0A7D4XLU9_9BACT|nr:hypothetical protein [Vitiosangium cumulatum]
MGFQPSRFTPPPAPAGLPARFEPQPSWGGQLDDGRSRFNQSCGAACAAPVNPSTGEILAPAATQAGGVLEKVVQAAEAVQGFITVSRFLDDAQKGIVEDVLRECVREANTKVDEELFGKGRSLPDSECEKEPVVRDKLAPTWRRHLGKLKHAAAFECIQRRLSEKFPNNFSIEPRLRKDELTEEVLLTDRRAGSLRPDIVIHFTHNVTRIQCIYDLKFPCGYAVGSNPWSDDVVMQMNSYGALGGECPPALVTPQRGIVRQ